MSYPIQLAIKVKNYKSFGEISLEGFDSLHRINLIIGRNNSGKSALLDIVRYITEPFNIASQGHKGRIPEVYITTLLTDNEIKAAFRENQSGGVIKGNFYEYGKKWIDKSITLRFSANGKEFINVDPPFDNDQITQEFGPKLTSVITNPISGKTFKRLLADRDIKPEGDTTPSLLQDGQGATNIIQNFLHKADRDSSLVEVKFLNALNEIFNPDANFKRVIVKQINTGAWEIFLDEETKGLIPLSDSGSGLKTIILVLVNILLIPALEGKQLIQYIFAFEELENNLHPGLQRRLLSYLRKIATEHECCFVITTHSNVIIDLFSKDAEAQITHVTHNGEYANARRVQTYIDNKGILDDLDVRASDLLQANGIVWLEGPSDRLYFNRWIELWTNGELKEGTHYQCVFYGGRLLAHLSARGDEQQETIDILNVNRNALLLIDSDKQTDGSAINATKQRIIREIENVQGLSWVTQGKEVENYIPVEAVKALYNRDDLQRVDQYQKFDKYLNAVVEDEGEKYLNNKVLFADRVIPHLTKADLEGVLDLKEKMELLVSRIKQWNNLT